jgi:DNA-binding winged helix-turn-helix (wHTH) protein
MRLRFGDFVLDRGSRELSCRGQSAHLSPKSFLLLEALIEARPRALSKSDLQARLWPGVFVSEVNVANLVSELRGVLGDDARRPRFVRTVHRFGYAFCAEAKEDRRATHGPAAPARYQLLWRGGRAVLTESEYVLGRSPGLEVCLDSPSVSRQHARLRVSAERVTLEDLGSKNGTYVRGRKLHGEEPLGDGDDLRLGSVHLKLRKIDAEGSTDTASGSSRRRTASREER